MDTRQPTLNDPIPTWPLPAVLGLLGAVMVLMALPAIVAVISIVDGHLVDRTQAWLGSSLALATPYLGLGRLGLTLALAAVVGTASEDGDL